MTTNKTCRPFGVEIEFYVPEDSYPKVREYDSWYGEYRYYPDYDKLYNILERKLGTRDWEVKEDGSLSDGGLEISSPVMYTRDFSEIKRVCSILNNMGAYVDESCGLHVHHDVSDFTDQDIIDLIKSWHQNQDTINLFVDESRLDNNYCEPWTTYEIENLETRGYAYEPKYKALAIASRSYLGTIEIRQHQSTLDYDEIRSWVLFGQAFVNSVKKKKIVRSYGVDGLLSTTRTYKIAQKRLKEKAGVS